MKKVFLSLAVIATLTVVSCKQAEAPATDAVDTTVVEEVAAPVVDTTAVDTTVVAPTTEAAPAAPAH